MKQIYLIATLTIFFSGCKLKDQQPEQQQKLPDNTSAMNNKASNNATGWEKITGDAAGATGTMGKQMEALNSTDQQKKYIADSIDRAMAGARTKREDSLRAVFVRDSIASLARTRMAAAAPKNTPTAGAAKSRPVVKTKPAAVAPKAPQSAPAQPAISEEEKAYTEGIEDFNTVVFKKKTKATTSTESAPASTSAAYTGKERFEDIDVSIPAVVHERTTVSSGGAMSVRTTKAVYIGQGITLPAGSIVTGFSDFQDDRLNLRIRSVNYNGRILRLSWKVYDTDGAEGIAVANATLKKNSSTGFNQTLSAAGQLITGNGAAGQVSSGMVRSIMSGSGRVSISVESGKKLIIKSAN